MSLTPFYSADPFGSNEFGMTPMGPSMDQLQAVRWQNQRNLATTMQSLRPFAPLLSTDLIEGDTDFHIHCDLPGVKQADLDITITDGNLIIKVSTNHLFPCVLYTF